MRNLPEPRFYLTLDPHNSPAFDPFDPDMLGALREVRAFLQAPEHMTPTSATFTDVRAYRQIRDLLDRAITKHSPAAGRHAAE